jgi:malate dehydrogenase
MFGADQPIILRMIEVETVVPALHGVLMELQDCAFPLLKAVTATASLEEGFEGAEWAILVGSVPRRAGMERKDLLGINGRIFVDQGRALARKAAPGVRVLVVGNPCNTNCLIAMNNAKSIPRDRWFAMTMLDENRAVSQLALKAGSDTTAVSNLAIWGNHSSTMYPDFQNAKIWGRPATDVINDAGWFEDTFIPTVQQRGAAIIKFRGRSSAASAANAVVDTVRRLTNATRPGDWFSVAVCPDGEYGIDRDLIYSYPIRSDGSTWHIVPGLELSALAKRGIAATENELLEERAFVSDLLAK